jgi:hypothetical protein
MNAITIVPWDVVVNIVSYVIFPAIVILVVGAFAIELWPKKKKKAS